MTKDILNIKLETAGAQLQLVNCLGQVIFNQTLTDQNFSFKAIDRVRVVIFFGGIKFHPKYIYPNGEANQAKATLTSNGYGTEFPSESFTWSVESDPDNTGAVISADGWIPS